MPWVYRIIIIVLLSWGFFTGVNDIIKPEPVEKIHIAEGAYLFTILDSKERAWFYGE